MRTAAVWCRLCLLVAGSEQSQYAYSGSVVQVVFAGCRLRAEPVRVQRRCGAGCVCRLQAPSRASARTAAVWCRLCLLVAGSEQSQYAYSGSVVQVVFAGCRLRAEPVRVQRQCGAGCVCWLQAPSRASTRTAAVWCRLCLLVAGSEQSQYAYSGSVVQVVFAGCRLRAEPVRVQRWCGTGCVCWLQAPSRASTRTAAVWCRLCLLVAGSEQSQYAYSGGVVQVVFAGCRLRAEPVRVQRRCGAGCVCWLQALSRASTRTAAVWCRLCLLVAGSEQSQYAYSGGVVQVVFAGCRLRAEPVRVQRRCGAGCVCRLQAPSRASTRTAAVWCRLCLLVAGSEQSQYAYSGSVVQVVFAGCRLRAEPVRVQRWCGTGCVCWLQAPSRASTRTAAVWCRLCLLVAGSEQSQYAYSGGVVQAVFAGCRLRAEPVRVQRRCGAGCVCRLQAPSRASTRTAAVWCRLCLLVAGSEQSQYAYSGSVVQVVFAGCRLRAEPVRVQRRCGAGCVCRLQAPSRASARTAAVWCRLCLPVAGSEQSQYAYSGSVVQVVFAGCRLRAEPVCVGRATRAAALVSSQVPLVQVRSVASHAFAGHSDVQTGEATRCARCWPYVLV